MVNHATGVRATVYIVTKSYGDTVNLAVGRDVIPNFLDNLIKKICAAMDIADNVQTHTQN
jgi:hypothetical protein